MKPNCFQNLSRLLALAGLVFAPTTPVVQATEPVPAPLRIQKISTPLPPDILRADLFLLRHADIPATDNPARSSVDSPSASTNTISSSIEAPSATSGSNANAASHPATSTVAAGSAAPLIATSATATPVTTVTTVTATPPAAVLILCPGVNGSGEHYLCDPRWQAFARQHRLDLVGLSYASEGPALAAGRGYYYPERGSGQALLDGLRKIYGPEPPPLLLHGFSGGSMFVGRFAEWAPPRVLAWCAHAAGWWEPPQRDDTEKADKISLRGTNSPSATIPSACATHPPGIVACGENDPFYGANLIYFKQGRAAGRPWLWVSLANTAHSPSEPLDNFVRHYFAVVLQGHLARRASPQTASKDTASTKTEVEDAATSQDLWLDVDFKTVITPAQAAQQPSLSAWLPSRELLEEWLRIHKP